MTKTKTIKHEDVIKAKMRDAKFKQAFKKEQVLARLAVEIAEMRLAKGLSQTEMAQKLHTTQQTISRWEKNNYGNIEVKSLEKIAEVFGKCLKISFQDY
jgi:DNA-binding XRE family transcriptional regulator